MLSRFRIIPFEVEHRAHAEMRVRVIGRNFKRLAVAGQRLVLFALVIQLLPLLDESSSRAGRLRRSRSRGSLCRQHRT